MANIAARRLSRTVAARHPDVTLREVDVDAVAAELYSRPESFDVILTSNVYGDILSKLANALAGSVGLASVRNVIAATLIAPAAGLPDRQLTTPPPGAKASHFELRPVLGIYALIGFGTLTLWLLTIQLAFHLAGIGLASPVFAGVALGTPCLTGILIGTLFERVRQILRFSVDCGAGVCADGNRLCHNLACDKHTSRRRWTAARRSWFWPQSTKLLRLALEPRRHRISWSGRRRSDIRGVRWPARIALRLPAIGSYRWIGCIVRDHCRHLSRGCDGHALW
jgi:hypothetical protein